jgi:hypothetical protein
MVRQTVKKLNWSEYYTYKICEIRSGVLVSSEEVPESKNQDQFNNKLLQHVLSKSKDSGASQAELYRFLRDESKKSEQIESYFLNLKNGLFYQYGVSCALSWFVLLSVWIEFGFVSGPQILISFFFQMIGLLLITFIFSSRVFKIREDLVFIKDFFLLLQINLFFETNSLAALRATQSFFESNFTSSKDYLESSEKVFNLWKQALEKKPCSNMLFQRWATMLIDLIQFGAPLKEFIFEGLGAFTLFQQEELEKKKRFIPILGSFFLVIFAGGSFFISLFMILLEMTNAKL